MPSLSALAAWSPVKLDALGLVITLGAERVRNAIGCLVDNPVANYFPIAAPQVIADNSFADPIPGFHLYNITDGIMTTDVSAWFTRWLMTQDPTYNSTVLEITTTLSET
ncbi:hypothetical protein BDW74DRAFT_173933 [Aspergillus multicolor]|uniref:uncharacterized protein n=1 Tax=Aspergillus multicolor TaxID=41759 RepID=UPI003CCD5CCD